MNKDEEIGNCNADPDQPNNIHINFFNTGYKKGKLDAEKEADSRLEEERLKAKAELLKTVHEEITYIFDPYGELERDPTSDKIHEYLTELAKHFKELQGLGDKKV